jgi:hypothetical protein
MAKHAHRKVNESRIKCWTGCVAHGSGDCGAAHGGVVYVDACRCGATRETEVNGCHRARGPWIVERPDDDDR